MKTATPFLALLPAALLAGGPTHFDVQATFVPPSKANAGAAIAVFFTAKDADVRVNEDPAPRIKLDQAQTVLVANPSPKAEAPPAEPGTTRYLDLTAPVRFPVTLGTGAAKGTHLVKGSVSYFYCSKREGWCRKGVSEVEIPVLVR